jgi:hypothetical protein
MDEILKKTEQIYAGILKESRDTLARLELEAADLLEWAQGDPARAMLAKAAQNVADAYWWSVRSLEERIEGGPSVVSEVATLTELSGLLLESTCMLNEGIICNM